ncbi:hypothetical protein J1614_003788 [Plenodomus biglobosus]|nr:hypothetical protein J1614_003788 [Plenodomus biglobosus]
MRHKEHGIVVENACGLKELTEHTCGWCSSAAEAHMFMLTFYNRPQSKRQDQRDCRRRDEDRYTQEGHRSMATSGTTNEEGWGGGTVGSARRPCRLRNRSVTCQYGAEKLPLPHLFHTINTNGAHPQLIAHTAMSTSAPCCSPADVSRSPRH